MYDHFHSLYQSKSDIFYIMKNYCRISVFLLLTTVIFACSEQEPENFEAHIMQLTQNNEYSEALDLLREAEDRDPDKVHRLKVQTHLAYANYLTHEADHLAMGDRMSDALRHFRRVLELDENNSQARSHIDLIEGIYQQMGRDVPEGVAE